MNSLKHSITALLFTAILFIPMSAQAQILPYTDKVIESVNTDTKAFDDVGVGTNGIAASELYRRGVISGYPDGEFKGMNPVNRAEAAKFLMLARYAENGTSSNLNSRFPDTPSKQWYIPYINKTAELGIISGYPDGTFKPANTINTAEFLKMLTLTFNIPTNLPHNYEDVPADAWYAKYAGVAQEYYFFTGVRPANQLLPSQAMTRYDVAVAIYRYLQFTNGTGAEMSETVVVEEEEESESESSGPGSDYTKRNYTVQPLTQSLKEKLNTPDRSDEKVQAMSVVSNGNHYAVVPDGYEELGKAHVNDLIYCNTILDEFFGMSFPQENMVVKVYESSDGRNSGSMGYGVAIYKRTTDLLEMDLENVLEMKEGGFLYNSGPTYCANTHEITHVYFDEWKLPGFLNEGLPEYAQSINQAGSKNHYECRENGFYGKDYYGNEEWRLISFDDMVPFQGDYTYTTAKCLIEELANEYLNGDFIKDLVKQLRIRDPFSYDYSQIKEGDDYIEDFYIELLHYTIDDILYPVYGPNLYSILEKYGITEEGELVYY